MRKSRFTSEQIVQAPRRAEAGNVFGHICRKLVTAEATICRWKKMYAGLELVELRRLRLRVSRPCVTVRQTGGPTMTEKGTGLLVRC